MNSGPRGVTKIPGFSSTATFFDVRFPVVSHHCLRFAGHPGSGALRALLLQTTDFFLQVGVLFLQLLDCPLQFLQSLGLGVAAGGLRPQRLD